MPYLLGDINQDGIVNSIDLSILVSNWNGSDSTSDLNQDGVVDSIDLSLLVGNWGETTPDPGMTWQEIWDTQDFTIIKAWYLQNTGLLDPEAIPQSSEGRIYSSAEGEVIENRRISVTDGSTEAAIVVNHENVVIRNCFIYAEERSAAIRFNSSAHNGAVEHCEIDGSLVNYGTGRDDANFGNLGILFYGNGCTAYRNHVYNARSGCRPGPSGQAVENFIEKLHVHAPGVSSSSISYSNISTSPGAEALRNLVEVGSSAAMTVYSQTASAQNYLKSQNIIATQYAMQNDDFDTAQSSYGVYGGYTGDFREGIANIRIENNRFVGNYAFGWPGEGTNGAVNVEKPGCTFIGNRLLGSSTDLASNINV